MSGESEKFTVFKALEFLYNNENVQSNISAPSGANLVLFLPQDDGSISDKDDGGDVGGFPDNLCRNQLIGNAELEFEEFTQHDDIHTFGSGVPQSQIQVKFNTCLQSKHSDAQIFLKLIFTIFLCYY